MIINNGKEIVQVNKSGKIITRIVRDGKALYDYIRSCFGRGFWVNDRPWSNKDGFKL